MRSDILTSVALVALYASSAVAGPIDSVRHSEDSQHRRREENLSRRSIADLLSAIGLGANNAAAPAQPPANAAPPPPPIKKGVAPQPAAGTGAAPPPPPADGAPFANGTIPAECPPPQTVTVTVTQNVGGNGGNASATIAPPAVTASSPAGGAPQPPAATAPAGTKPAPAPPAQNTPLPTEVATTQVLVPLDPIASAPVITNTALQPAQPAQAIPRRQAGGIDGSTGNSGTINNIQVVVVQLTNPGATQTVTSTVNGVPVIETITEPASTVLSTVTLTDGATATGTMAAIPSGAEFISSVTMPAPPAGVLPPPGAVASGVLPPPGTIESGAATPSSPPLLVGVLPPPGAVETGVPALPVASPVYPIPAAAAH